MATQFAHLLLFVCPNCRFPIIVGCLSHDRSLENVDAEHFAASCASCGRSFNISGTAAKKHYVEDWPYERDEH
jgi:hypothetical protein